MFRRPSLDALWFVGSGLALILIGALTRVARRAPARLVCGVALAANAAGLALAVTFGALTGWREPQGPLLVLIFIAGGVAIGRLGTQTTHPDMTPSTDPKRVTTQLNSVLRCPACGHEDALTMPTDACLFFHPCAGCGAMLRPKPGDCCVFCSFGSVPCPPIQEGASCCGDASTGAAAATGALTPLGRRGRA